MTIPFARVLQVLCSFLVLISIVPWALIANFVNKLAQMNSQLLRLELSTNCIAEEHSNNLCVHRKSKRIQNINFTKAVFSVEATYVSTPKEG